MAGGRGPIQVDRKDSSPRLTSRFVTDISFETVSFFFELARVQDNTYFVLLPRTFYIRALSVANNCLCCCDLCSLRSHFALHF